MKFDLHFFLFLIVGCGMLNAQISFGEHIIDVQSSVLRFVKLGDLDNDGDIDIVASFGYGYDSSLFWYENIDGLGNFSSPQIITSDPAVLLEIGDFENDGDIDLLYFIYDGGTDYHKVKLNDGDGDFTETLSAGGVYDSWDDEITWNDYDGDGDLDIYTVGWTLDNTIDISYRENLIDNPDASSFFNSQPINNILLHPAIVEIDYDNDGDIDVFRGNRYYENEFGIQNIDLNDYVTAVEYTDDYNAVNIFLSDLDDDGDLDLISWLLKTDTQTFGRIVWHENLDGFLGFGTEQVISTFPYNDYYRELIETSDIDNDGDIDLIARHRGGNYLYWHENLDGLGTFSDSQIIINDISTGGIDIFKIEDINGDGLVDIVCSKQSGSFVWLENLSNGSNEITGEVNLDINNDSCSSGDFPLQNVLVTASDDNNSFATFTNSLGEYQMNTSSGDFEISSSTSLLPYYASNPDFYSTNFTGSGESEILNFCMEPDVETNNLSVSLYPLNEARPGFDAHYQIVFKNTGTTTLGGSVSLDFDASKMSFTSASESLLSETSNTISFEYSDLVPFEQRTIDVTFTIEVPPIANNDDVILFTASINPISGDYSESDNTFELDQILVGSFDPNDIKVLEGSTITLENASDYLHYIIRFQNTGTASAINVKVTNNLDDDLDWTSLQIENISHPNTVRITNGNLIEFEFNDINLPDSTSNEPDSHGYIQYKVKPKSTVALGDLFTNNASIYFDFNQPIETNTVNTLIVDNLSIEDNQLSGTFVFPNPIKGTLSVESVTPISSITVYDQLGKVITVSNNSNTVDLSSVSQGLYFVQIEAVNGSTSIKKVIKH